jgi:hypothetical protein
MRPDGARLPMHFPVIPNDPTDYGDDDVIPLPDTIHWPEDPVEDPGNE